MILGSATTDIGSWTGIGRGRQPADIFWQDGSVCSRRNVKLMVDGVLLRGNRDYRKQIWVIRMMVLAQLGYWSTAPARFNNIAVYCDT
jgi:hypothetical protein